MQSFAEMTLKVRLVVLLAVVLGLNYLINNGEFFLDFVMPRFLGFVVAFVLAGIVDYFIANTAYVRKDSGWLIHRDNDVYWAEPGWYFKKARQIFRIPSEEFQCFFPPYGFPSKLNLLWKIRIKMDNSDLKAVRAYVLWIKELWKNFDVEGSVDPKEISLRISTMIDEAIRQPETQFTVLSRRSL